jgi:hypothetical protein
MKHRIHQAPGTDSTVSMLDSLRDGSLAGLAQYHLLKMQLDAIRNLPEVSDRDGVGSAPD